MDPLALNANDWNNLGNIITFLWLALISAIITGPTLLIAHAIIPSAVATKTINEKYNKLRPGLYLMGGIGVICIILFFCLAGFQSYAILKEFYPSFWQ
tara:strand:- start:1335 stop:1628 length:294 start_codon:yes stop_codon:yes gene_type:complete